MNDDVSSSMTPEEFIELFHNAQLLHDPEARRRFTEMCAKYDNIEANEHWFRLPKIILNESEEEIIESLKQILLR